MPVILGLVLNSYVFSFPTFVLVCLFAFGRVAHIVGYAEKGYGGHGPGFGIAMVSSLALYGLFLVVGMKSI